MGAQIPETVIADTVAAVLSDPAYHRVALFQRLGLWLLNLVRSILARFEPGRVPSPVFWIIVIAVLAAVLLIVARAVWLLAAGRTPGRRAGNGQTPGSGRADAWAAAALLAARGEYTAAAHELYGGLLAALAGRGDVELHESKTAGDYRRDLRRRGSGFTGRFGEFANQYELAIYGLGSCDRERYDRLQELARRTVESGA